MRFFVKNGTNMLKNIISFSLFLLMIILSFFFTLISHSYAGTCVTLAGCLYSENESNCNDLIGSFGGVGYYRNENFECPTVCCEVKDASGKSYVGVSYSGYALTNFSCEHISDLTENVYNYVTYYTIDGSDICSLMGLIKEDGSLEDGFFQKNICRITFKANVIDGATNTPISDTLNGQIEIYEGDEISGTYYLTIEDGWLEKTVLLGKTCPGNITFSIKIGGRGKYVDFSDTFTNTLSGEFNEIFVGNLPLVSINTFWEITVKILPSDLKNLWLVTYYLDENDNEIGREYFFIPLSGTTIKIPKDLRIKKVKFSSGFIDLDDKRYYLPAEEELPLSVSDDKHTVELGYIYSLPAAHIKVCWNSSGSVTLSLNQSPWDYYYGILVRAGDKYCTNPIPVFSSGTYEIQGHNQNSFSERKSINVERGLTTETITEYLQNTFSLDKRCYSVDHLTLPITSSSKCVKACRKYYEYDCNTNSCEISDDPSNWIRNMPHPGVCDGDYFCDNFGRCVPREIECSHTNTLEDCSNVAVLDGFYYCNESNKLEFINLTQLFYEGKFEVIEQYCGICSLDKECHLCDNPNPVFGKTVTNLTSCMNISSSAAGCIDRVLKDSDLQKIKNGEYVSTRYTLSSSLKDDIFKIYDLNNNRAFYEFCFLRGCGDVFSEFCSFDCDNEGKVNELFGSFTGKTLQCLDESNVYHIFSFGECPDGEVCGLSSEELCYGREFLEDSNLHNKYAYLCTIQGGRLINDENCCDVPLLAMPQCGIYNDKKLNEITISDISTASPTLYDVLQRSSSPVEYLNNNRGDIWCSCLGQLVNLSSNQYCCANGLSSLPCNLNIDLNIYFFINYSGMVLPLDGTENLILRQRYLGVNSLESQYILTDNSLKLTDLPVGIYEFSILHPMFPFFTRLNITPGAINKECDVVDISKEVKCNFTIQTNNNYYLIKGYVRDSATNQLLKNIDVKITVKPMDFSSILNTDPLGVFVFNYVSKNSLESLVVDANRFSNPFYTSTSKTLNKGDEELEKGNITIYLNKRKFGNIRVTVKEFESLKELENATVKILSLNPSTKPEGWPEMIIENKTNASGVAVLKNIPCEEGSSTGAPITILVHKFGYEDKKITIVPKCGDNIEVELWPIDCLEQTATVEDIDFYFEPYSYSSYSLLLYLSWKFFCKDYVKGFYIYLREKDSTQWKLISHLLPNDVCNDDFSCEVTLDFGQHFYLYLGQYFLNHGDRGILNYSLRIGIVWDKPFYKYDLSSEVSKLFDFGAVNPMWHKKIVKSQYTNLGFDLVNDHLGDVLVAKRGVFVNASDDCGPSCITNNSRIISLPFFEPFVELGYNGYNATPLFSGKNSFLVNGPFLGFGRQMNVDLPLIKGESFHYYKPMCGDVRNCYDYTTKSACDLNPCLPFECSWNGKVCIPMDASMVECNYSKTMQYPWYGVYLSTSSAMSVGRKEEFCSYFGYLNGPKSLFFGNVLTCHYSPPAGNCVSELETDFSSEIRDYAIHPLFPTEELLRSSEGNFYVYRADLMRTADVSPTHLGYRHPSDIRYSVLNPPYRILNFLYPPIFIFTNKFYYKTMSDLKNELQDAISGVSKNGTVYDIDSTLRNLDESYNLNAIASIKRVCGLDHSNRYKCISSSKKINLMEREFEASDFGFSELDRVDAQITSQLKDRGLNQFTYIFDASFDNNGPRIVNLKVTPVFKSVYEQTYFYIINLSFDIQNEDFAVAELNIEPLEFFDPYNPAEKIEASSYSVLENFSLNDGPNKHFVKTIAIMKYPGETPEFSASKDRAPASFNYNFSNYEGILLAGIYNLHGRVIDRLGNEREISINFTLWPKTAPVDVGYYKSYFVNETAEIFISSKLELEECRFDFEDVNFYDMDYTYNKANDTFFHYSLDPSVVASNIASHVFMEGKEYPVGNVKIYSACLDKFGDISEVPPINIFYDSGNFTCMISKSSPISTSDLLEVSHFDLFNDYYFVCMKTGGNFEHSKTTNLTEILNVFEENTIFNNYGSSTFDYSPSSKPITQFSFDLQSCFNTTPVYHYYKPGYYFMEIGFKCFASDPRLSFEVSDGFKARTYEFSYTLDDASPLLLDYKNSKLTCSDGTHNYIYSGSFTSSHIDFYLFNPQFNLSGYAKEENNGFFSFQFPKGFIGIIPRSSDVSFKINDYSSLIFNLDASGELNVKLEISLSGGSFSKNLVFYNVAFVELRKLPESDLSIYVHYYNYTLHAYNYFDITSEVLNFEDAGFSLTVDGIYDLTGKMYVTSLDHEDSVNVSYYHPLLDTLGSYRAIFNINEPLISKSFDVDDKEHLEGELKLRENDHFSKYNISFNLINTLPIFQHILVNNLDENTSFDLFSNSLPSEGSLCLEEPINIEVNYRTNGWQERFLNLTLVLYNGSDAIFEYSCEDTSLDGVYQCSINLNPWENISLVDYLLQPLTLKVKMRPSSKYCDDSAFSKEDTVAILIPTKCKLPEIQQVDIFVEKIDNQFSEIKFEKMSPGIRISFNKKYEKIPSLLIYNQDLTYNFSIIFDDTIYRDFLNSVSIRCNKLIGNFSIYKSFYADSFDLNSERNVINAIFNLSMDMDYDECMLVIDYNNGVVDSEITYNLALQRLNYLPLASSFTFYPQSYNLYMDGFTYYMAYQIYDIYNTYILYSLNKIG